MPRSGFDVWRWGIKPAVFALALLPFAWLVYGAFAGDLGANPVETITFTTGDWGMRFLLLTLAVTPLRKLLALPRLLSLRRMLGLYCFFYATLHLLTFFLFDHEFDWIEIGKDIIERPFVTLGMAAFLLLLPLALTSTNGWQRRLGRRWLALHRLVYPAAVLVIWHFLMLVKADLREPLIWACILTALLVFRALPPRLQDVPWLRRGWRRLWPTAGSGTTR